MNPIRLIHSYQHCPYSCHCWNVGMLGHLCSCLLAPSTLEACGVGRRVLWLDLECGVAGALPVAKIPRRFLLGRSLAKAAARPQPRDFTQNCLPRTRGRNQWPKTRLLGRILPSSSRSTDHATDLSIFIRSASECWNIRAPCAAAWSAPLIDHREATSSMPL